MPESEAEFLKRLLATFQVEAEEHVNALFSGLLELEKASASDRKGIIETVFREAHSLKGAARSVNLPEVESVCQQMESMFAELKGSELEVSPGMLDPLHALLDSLRQSLARAGSDSPKRKPDIQPSPATSPVAQPKLEVPLVEDRPHLPETVRVSTARLDSLLLQAEEFLSAKLAAEQHAEWLRELVSFLAAWKKERARVRAELRSPRSLSAPGDRETYSNGMQLFDKDESFMQMLGDKVEGAHKQFERECRALSGMVDTLLDDMKTATMLPFSSLLALVRKLARDLSREQGKSVDVVVLGGDLEMDRRILEELKDPLVHIIRNSIDHGIESPELREQKGKFPTGTVTLSATRLDGKVEIRVADDGKGIDAARLRESAMQAGVINEQEAASLNSADISRLIFRSGISTSPTLTTISGRGLGLAIVQEKVEKLGGVVSVESQVDVGTTFNMLLPLSLSTSRGIILQIEERIFVLPSTHVQRVLRVKREEIKTVENRETISFNGVTLPLVWLGTVLGMERTTPDWAAVTSAIIVGAGDAAVAFGVNEIRQEQEVLLKNLGKQLTRVRNIAGATILGGGHVVPVLNVPDLIKSASGSALTRLPVTAPSAPKKKARILVVDDSITSRTLLKSILETNGYQVETAVDGMDGFTKLRAGDFALVISDVEMPRMNGFELTARIRGDRKFTGLPVVLVTALASQEDRERGVDAGASAYLVKSNFDQSDLLEAIQRFV